MKESIKVQYSSSTMVGKWPSNEDSPNFEETAKPCMRKCNRVIIQDFSQLDWKWITWNGILNVMILKRMIE